MDFTMGSRAQENKRTKKAMTKARREKAKKVKQAKERALVPVTSTMGGVRRAAKRARVNRPLSSGVKTNVNLPRNYALVMNESGRVRGALVGTNFYPLNKNNKPAPTMSSQFMKSLVTLARKPLNVAGRVVARGKVNEARKSLKRKRETTVSAKNLKEMGRLRASINRLNKTANAATNLKEAMKIRERRNRVKAQLNGLINGLRSSASA